MHRQPFREVAGRNNDAGGSPSKVQRSGELCTPHSVFKNAARVIRAVEDSQSLAGGSQGEEDAEVDELFATPVAAVAGLPDSSPFSAASLQVDSAVLNRLADDVAQTDVVSAWEQVESLQRQLRARDEELREAVLAIEQLRQQQQGSPPHQQPLFMSAEGREGQSASPPSAGSWLQEQLAQREEEAAQAHRQAALLQQQLLAKDRALSAAEAQARALALRATQAEDELAHACAALAAADRDRAGLQEELAAARAYADEQSEASNRIRLELAEARDAAGSRIEQLEQELAAAQAQLQAIVGHDRAEPGTVDQPTVSISLRGPPGTAFHSPPASPVSDVFGSPQQAERVAPGGPAMQPVGQQLQQAAGPAGTNSGGSFQFQPLLGPALQRQSSGNGEEELGDEAASSSGETDDTVSEAALVARTMRRVGPQEREPLQDVFRGLQQLKHKHQQVHAQLAYAHSPTAQPGPAWQQKEQQQPQQGQSGAAAMAGRELQLREAALQKDRECHYLKLEEKQLRSEVAALQSKCESNNQMLLKANQAMKILHYKLQKERKTVARLQDEKCQLQSQLLAANAANAPIIEHNAAQEQARLLHAEQERAALAAQLEQQQRAAAVKATELAQLSEVAHASTEDLLQARETLQQERARAEGLAHERAELQGRVHALQETLQGLGHWDNALLQLTEQKALLQLQLRDSQAAATAAQSAQAEQMAYISELEQACQALRQQLDEAIAQHCSAYAAVEAAADRLQQLADAREALEQQLALAQQDAARTAAELANARAERDGLAGQVQQFMAHNAELQESVQALQAECSAVRLLEAKTEAQNVQLVDNMCDMTGLIDAVQAMQHRNRLMQQDLDKSKARLDEATAALEAKTRQHAETAAALETCRSQLEEAQGAATAAAKEAAALESERAALQERQAELRGRLEGAEEAQRAQRADADRALQELQERLREREVSLQRLSDDKEAWQVERGELQGQLAAAKKAQALAQSKLVLSRQREAQLKEASEQFASLQEDLRGYLEDCEAMREAKEQAEDRCQMLERRVASLEQNDEQVTEQAMSAREEASQLKEANLALEEQLAGLQLSYAQLEQQHAAAQRLQKRLCHLESEQQSSAEWFDALSAELADKAAEVAQVQAQLAGAQQAQANMAAQLEGAQQRLAEAQEAQADADSGWQAASAALQEAESQLAAANQRCEALEGREREASRALAAVVAAKESAERRTAELEGLREELQTECMRLRQQAEALGSSSCAAVAELQRQAAHLGREREELSAQLEATKAAHQQQLASMQAGVDECQASCNELSAELAAANAARQGAEQRAENAAEEARDAAERANQLQAQLAEAEGVRDSLQAQHNSLAAEAAQHAQRAEQLRQQCTALEERLDVLEGQLAALQDQCEATTEQLQAARAELADAQSQRRALHEQLEHAVEARHAAQAAAAEAAVTERAAREALARQSGELEALRGRVAEGQQRAADIEALGARLEEAEAQLARSQARDDVLQDVSRKLEAQMEVLQRVGEAASGRLTATAASEGGQPASPTAGTPRSAVRTSEQLGPARALARRELLVQALERLEDLQAENQQLWRLVESQLAASRGSGGCQSGLHPSGPADSADQAEMDAKLSAAQATIERLQRQVEQLSAVAAAAAAAQHSSLPASSSASRGTAGDLEAWQGEKRVLKAVCKLALAVTMDQVGGRCEAAAVAQELEPTMGAHAPVLHQLGLFKVWRSLHKLAASPRPSQAPADAAAALQQQQLELERCHAECRALKAKLAEVEAATAKWQGQADSVEQALSLLRFQLEDLLSECKWVLEDFSSPEDPPPPRSEDGASLQLGQVVGALSRTLRRLLRKYRTLSSLLAYDHDREEGQQRHHRLPMHQIGDPQPRRHDGGTEGVRPATSGAVGATSNGRSGSGAGALLGDCLAGMGAQGGAASELLVAEARDKAASIAERLDRLLTPHSRAAVHGGGSSRFLTDLDQIQSEAAAEAGGGQWSRATETNAAQWAAGTWGLGGGGWHASDQWGEDDDIPLRQRFGRRSMQ